MNTMTFDQILSAASQLTPQEQETLIARLRAKSVASVSERGILLRETIMSEFDRRKAAGDFDNLGSLKGKFARSGAQADADEVESYLHSLNAGWEEDLDDLVT